LIYVGGPDFRIRFMNGHFIEMLGRDATGEPCFHALHGRDEPCPWCPREVFAGKSASGIFQKPTDGRWYHVVNLPLPLSDGAFAKVAFIRECSEPESRIKDLPVFRNIVDQLSDAVFFHALEDGRILYVNDLACSSLGQSREALLGMLPSGYADAPVSPLAWRKMVDRIEKEGVTVFEARHRSKDGMLIDVEVNATKVRAGLERFIVTVARDITKRKQTENRLVEERNKVEAIMAAMGDGVTVQDLDFRIIYQNEVLIRRRGHRLGEPCYRVYADRDDICEDCQAQKSIADGQAHRRPFTTTTPENSAISRLD
jgi:PAS domain S-box-containing protein